MNTSDNNIVMPQSRSTIGYVVLLFFILTEIIMDVSRDKKFSSAGNQIGHLTVKQNLLVSSSS